MTSDIGGDDYRAWVFTFASSLACVFGAGLIFIDTIVKKVLGRDVQILHNHKFLAGSLGLGSGVMIFSSFYNLLPEAKEQLSSELSIFKDHADAYVMLFFFGGVGIMALIHWIMHRFDSGSTSPGIENSGAIEQFMQREARQQQTVDGGHHHSFSAASASTAVAPSGSVSAAQTCQGCVHEESEEGDEGDPDEEERYNDSEYVDDEVTSLLDNAFLQIGKTPEGRRRHQTGGDDRVYEDDDGESIEVVIADQKEKILRRTADHGSDLDIHGEHDEDEDHHTSGGVLSGRKNSWSSVSTSSQKPFAPMNKRKKNGSGSKVKGRRRAKECHLDHTTDRNNREYNQASEHRPLYPSGHHTHPTTYGTVPSTMRPNGPSSSSPYHPPRFSQNSLSSHVRRTSFPRLNQRARMATVESGHDNLDHAVTDDNEHADLAEIGIQTALTIAVHKFPEGLITFLSTTADPCLGLSVFMAIAVHNLIEGYLIAFPLFVGLRSRTKAFALAAALGGLSQPLGAILGWFILRKVASLGWQVSATGCIYALVAGMMASIAVNGMWPQAVKCVGRNPTKVVQISFFAGIAIMGICQAVMGSSCDF